MADVEVTNNTAQHRFEVNLEGHTAFAEYRVSDRISDSRREEKPFDGNKRSDRRRQQHVCAAYELSSLLRQSVCSRISECRSKVLHTVYYTKI